MSGGGSVHQRTRSGAQIFLLASIPGMVVVGYFNVTAFFTMVACVLGLPVCCGLGKLYYSKKL